MSMDDRNSSWERLIYDHRSNPRFSRFVMVNLNLRKTFSVTQDQLVPGSLLFSKIVLEWRDDVDQTDSLDCEVCGGSWAPIIILFEDGDEVEGLLHRRKEN
jgi:hypothetical protein